MILTLLLALASQSETRFVHEAPGFEVGLPSADWIRREAGSAGGLTVVLAPVKDLSTRCSILHMQRSVLRDGMATREEQLRGAADKLYERVSLGADTLAARAATRLEYRIAGTRIVEWAFEDGSHWVIFQLAAPAAAWDDAEVREALDGIRDSFVWRGGKVPPLRVSRTSPHEIRAQRRAALRTAAPKIEVVRHRIVATIEPDERSLDVEDIVEIRALEDGAKQLTLYTTLVNVDDVTCDAPIRWRLEEGPAATALVVDFEEPLAAGAELMLLVHAACDDYFQAVDQKLVEEVAVLGQIRPRSSYSSHVVWYPIDERNDAAVDITFDVPAPNVALTGGELVESAEEDGRRTYRYVETVRIRRLLPFGFAVGEYVSREGESGSGLKLSAWGFPGEEKRVDQRVEVLLQAAAAFERAFGALPWKTVRFAHVRPERKETGVSLPGLIVVSDGYFPDLEGVDLSDGDLSRRSALGLLVVADELSHQWNIYASGLPNELGEGISTFTNALFVEARHGHDAYLRTLRSTRDAWIAGAVGETEFAVADPAVYSNSRYRSVVFCKTPIVLHALRRELGDELFFTGLRRAFDLRDAAIDGFERLQLGFEEASARDLGPFFDQWFYRAGFPIVVIEHAATPDGARVTVRQTQEEKLYDFAAPIRVECDDGSVHEFTVPIREREQGFEWPLPAPARSVTIGADGTLPARVDS